MGQPSSPTSSANLLQCTYHRVQEGAQKSLIAPIPTDWAQRHKSWCIDIGRSLHLQEFRVDKRRIRILDQPLLHCSISAINKY